MSVKTYRAKATCAFPRSDPTKPMRVIVKGDLYELDLKDIPKHLHDMFVDVASAPAAAPKPDPEAVAAEKPATVKPASTRTKATTPKPKTK